MVGSWSAHGLSGDDYDRTYDARAAAGEDVHGEARFVMRFAPRTVLDAGCGTGRIARELARRGVATVGADRDQRMLSTAQAKAPDLDWRLADLATAELGGPFDVALMAGNVMLFVDRGTEGAVLANMARHLHPGGRLIAGFQVGARAPDRAVRRAGAGRRAGARGALVDLGSGPLAAGRRLRRLGPPQASACLAAPARAERSRTTSCSGCLVVAPTSGRAGLIGAS
jgi:SAM-dependent methyltransferase